MFCGVLHWLIISKCVHYHFFYVVIMYVSIFISRPVTHSPDMTSQQQNYFFNNYHKCWIYNVPNQHVKNLYKYNRATNSDVFWNFFWILLIYFFWFRTIPVFTSNLSNSWVSKVLRNHGRRTDIQSGNASTRRKPTRSHNFLRIFYKDNYHWN